MATRIVNIHDAKTHLSELLAQALAGDEAIIIEQQRSENGISILPVSLAHVATRHPSRAPQRSI